MSASGLSRFRTAVSFVHRGSEATQQIKTELSEKRVRQSRPHLYELDPLRATTAVIVVAVHTLSFTVSLNQSTLGAHIQNAFVISAHYTREMFMFVTAFSLVYAYYDKPFSATRFWERRAQGVLLPYCLWSFIYLLLSQTQYSVGSFIETLMIDLISGRASFQLYYILLTLQFYLLFPLFLPFVGYLKRRPWTTVTMSFVLEVLLLSVDYLTIQRGTGANEPFWHLIAQYQYSLVFMYQFYFILGALAALYLPQIRSFLQQYGWWTLVGFLIALLALWVHFFIQLLSCKESVAYATSVLQPIMAFYSFAVIAFFFWLAYRWAGKVNQKGYPRGYRIWSILSDASFGIYLVHPIFLNVFMLALVPAMPETWPVSIRVFLTWFMTAGCATLASLILLHIPLLSRLVGRSHTSDRRVRIERLEGGDNLKSKLGAECKPGYAIIKEKWHFKLKR